MRLLAALLALATLAAGCITTANLDPAALPGAALPEVAVHRAGLPLDVPAAQVLGSVPGVVQRLVGERGAEPNLGMTSSGALFVSAFDHVMRSTDQGLTWESVYEFGTVRTPEGTPIVGTDPIGNSDPMLWVDPVTDRVFAPGMWPPLVCAQATFSDDDGASWYDMPMGCNPLAPPFDHQKLATGSFVEGSRLAALRQDYPNAVYLCYNKLVATHCQLSADGGRTWPFDVPVASGAQCGGINGHPTAAPDGTLYVPLGFSCGQPTVARSADNGFSWRVVPIRVGGLGQAELDPEVAVSPDGTAYYFFRAAQDHRVYVVRSTDGFDTTSRPFLVSPPDITSTRFAAMAAGDDGVLAFAYLGTRDTAGAPGDAHDEARWHLFTTFTRDATAEQPTFVTVQVTPAEDPVQIGYTWEGGGGNPGRNLLDFIDGIIGPDGRFYVAFTDGCTEDCAGNATATKRQSRARDVALAVQVDGPLLRAPPAAGEAPAQARAAAPAREAPRPAA
jgi:hypothetical protein